MVLVRSRASFFLQRNTLLSLAERLSLCTVKLSLTLVYFMSRDGMLGILAFPLDQGEQTTPIHIGELQRGCSNQLGQQYTHNMQRTQNMSCGQGTLAHDMAGFFSWKAELCSAQSSN